MKHGAKPKTECGAEHSFVHWTRESDSLIRGRACFASSLCLFTVCVKAAAIICPAENL